MGRVTDELVRAIKRQVDDHGIVVWYDPSREYEGVVSSLELEKILVARFAGSFFRLRHEVDELLEGDRPRLVVYVPLPREEAHEPLIELAAAGVEAYPGASSRPCNTRLSVMAKPLFDDAVWRSIGKNVESGRIGLADLDRLAERPAGMLSLIFGGAAPEVIALEFVTSDRFDAAIGEKTADAELVALLQEHLGFVAPPAVPELAALRQRLARHVLANELVASIPEDKALELDGASVLAPGPTRDACVALCRTWRLRNDLAEAFAVAAARMEGELGLASLPLTREQLSSSEAFLCLEVLLQETIERALRGAIDPADVELARTRQTTFWARHQPEVGARWVLVATAGELLLTAQRVAEELRSRARTADELLTAYAGGERPWYLLDTYQRRLETLSYSFDWGDKHEALHELRFHAANRFAEVGGMLAEGFVRAYQQSRYEVPGLKRQRDVFRTYVAPTVARGKTAYVLVDALRFEMARELMNGLGEGFDASLDYVLGSVPSITEIGMAALMPGLDGDVELVEANPGKVALRIGDVVLKDRADRMKQLQANAGVRVCDLKLEDLLSNKRAVGNAIAASDLVVVTSQEIDLLCEQGNIALARNTMDTVVRDLRRGFNILARHKVESIVVTADHGYLFGDEAGSDMTIDPPKGQTVDLHRRVWVGRGGDAVDACVRVRSADLGWRGDLEIVAPWNMACFKAGGAKAYFHGGLAPQEVVVPVAVLNSRKPADAAREAAFSWSLTTGSKAITTRFLSVRVEGQVRQLFEAVPPKVRLEVRTGTTVVSTPLHADYGFDESSGDVALRLDDSGNAVAPNTIVLQLQEAITNAETATVHMMDMGSGLELSKLGSIPVRIAL